MNKLALIIASALRTAADTIEAAAKTEETGHESLYRNLTLLPDGSPVPDAWVEAIETPAPEPVAVDAAIGTGGRPVAAILSAQDWITLMTDRTDGVAMIAMKHGAKQQTIQRLRQKALKGEVVTSLKAAEIFRRLEDGQSPEEISKELTVVLPTVLQAMGLLNATLVLKSRGATALPKLPIELAA